MTSERVENMHSLIERRVGSSAVAAVLGLLLVSGWAGAQETQEIQESQEPEPQASQEYWLLDDFSIKVGARTNSLDTTVRVDGPFGRGTSVDVENILGLDGDEDNFGVALEWRPGRRHVLAGEWVSHERESERVLDREIRIRDTVFEINASARSSLDIETLTLAYYYVVVLKDRLAFGVGGGARQWEYDLAMSASLQGQGQRSEQADASGPLPFVGLDFRYGITPRWRLRSSLGLFDIDFDIYSGTQIIAELAFEYRLLSHLSLGVAGDIGQLDADVDEDRWQGAIDSDIQGAQIYGRLLW